MWKYCATAFILATLPSASAETPGSENGSWLTFDGEVRMRYESLTGQFRKGVEGSDQLLLFRSLLRAEADTGPVKLGIELQDSRTYLGDYGTPLTSSIANPLDILQAYILIDDLKSGPDHNWSHTVKIGRQTISIGSKRQIERVSFANVIKSYTGVHLESNAASGDKLNAFYAVPLRRNPSSKSQLLDNDLSGDEEEWGRHIWGVQYKRANILNDHITNLSLEGFVFGFEETDRAGTPTADRSYISPGFRLYRPASVGQWDIDLEATKRYGTRYSTNSPSDTQSLDVNASMAFFALGYTFRAPWQPRLAFEFYHASGDEDPNDLNFDQHERLFGSRRSDLNNTSIHGPLTPANLNAPGFRLEIKPDKRWDARFYYHAAFLDSETDRWQIAGLSDPTGQSGNFIGHTLDARTRYWVVPERLRMEVGASGLIFGGFANDVPGGPSGDGTLFGYFQLTGHF